MGGGHVVLLPRRSWHLRKRRVWAEYGEARCSIAGYCLTVPTVRLREQFWRFLVAGGAAAAANFGSRFLFSQWVRYEWAILLAFLVGLTIGFSLMRGYVFNASGKPFGPQLAMYLTVNLFALLQTMLVSVALDRWVLRFLVSVSLAQALAHLVGVLVPMVTSYFGHRMATFR